MRKCGQITVFFSMALLCILALLCGLLESARTAGARCYLRTAANSSLDSVMAGYHKGLWDRYRILLREYSGEKELEEEFSRYFQGYLEAAGWYPVETENICVNNMETIMDHGGKALSKQVLDYMQYGIWTMEFSVEEGESLWKGLKEAQAVQETSRLYAGCGETALELEGALERIAACQERQQELYGEAVHELEEGNGEGFLKTGKTLIKELEKIPEAVEDYGRKADDFWKELEQVHSQVERNMQEMSPQMQAAAREEYESYRTYGDKNGERRREIEELTARSKRNRVLTEAVMEEAERVMKELETEEDSEEEEELSMWEPVSSHMREFERKTLSCTYGTADKATQKLLEQVGEKLGNGLLQMVLPEGTQISEEKLASGKLLSESMDHDGNQASQEELWKEMKDRLVMGEYCRYFFSDFLDYREGELAYQLEYLLHGDRGDRENLAGAAARILAVREGMNLIHILGSSQKREEARALAAAVVGIAGLPPLVEVMALMIMGIWALGESAEDLKALYRGKKVPFVKGEEDWKLSLEGLLEIGRGGSAEGEGGEKGIGYESYLKLLLLAADQERTRFRMMDVMEDTIGRGEPGFSLKQCGSRIEITAYVTARHLFFREHGLGDYGLDMAVARSY